MLDSGEFNASASTRRKVSGMIIRWLMEWTPRLGYRWLKWILYGHGRRKLNGRILQLSEKHGSFIWLNITDSVKDKSYGRCGL